MRTCVIIFTMFLHLLQAQALKPIHEWTFDRLEDSAGIFLEPFGHP